MVSINSKKLCVLALMLLPALFGASIFAQKKSVVPRFAGTWVLNREKSQGLTGQLGNAEIRMVIEQDDSSLSAEQQILLRGRQQPSQVLDYKLDGTETETEVVRPLAGTMKLKARWIESTKTLELISNITTDAEGKTVSINTKELWQLVGDDLKITRIRQSPQGTQTFRLFFEKP